MNIGRGLLSRMAFLLALALFFSTTPAFPQIASESKTAVWQIQDAVVVNRGKQSESDKGTTITGYTVEATALAQGDAPIKKGKFQVTLSAFSPAQEMGGQIPGTWYLRGTWTLTDVKASPEAAKARYSPAVLRGNFTAETEFNPAIEQGFIEAKVQTLTRGRGYGRKGGGTLSGNEKFEGQLSLNVGEKPK